MAAVPSELGGIAGGLLLNIIYGIAGLALIIGLWFGTRFLQKGVKKQKSFTIKATILDLNGVPDYDDLAFVKSDVHGMLEMQFKKRKQDTCPPIPKHLIKNNHVVLINYAPGHYCVLDTGKTAFNFNQQNRKIALINLHMKNYLGAKQRDAINKTEERKKKWDLWLPWLTLGFTVLLAIIGAALLMFLGIKFYDNAISERLAECIQATR